MRQLLLALILTFYTLNNVNANFSRSDLEKFAPISTATVSYPDPEDPVLTHVLRVNKQIDPEQASKIIDAAELAANEFDLDPLLLLALIKVESRFDQDAVGSGGSSKGLVQVIPYWHGDKISAGRKKLNTYSVFDIRLNTWLGAAILRDYMSKTKTMRAALVRYNASSRADEYAASVLAEYRKLKTL